MVINILLCDDDETCLNLNEKYIKEINQRIDIDANILKYTEMNSSMMERIKEGNIHIALLDIELQEGNGIQLAETIIGENPNVSIIFVTGYGQYTAQAFRIEAVGYLEKPVLQAQMERVYRRTIMTIHGFENEKEKRTILVKVGAKRIPIKCKDINYVEKVIKKVVIHTNCGKYEFYESIASIEKLLGDSFIRINQGIVVRKEEIVYTDKNNVFLKSGEALRIGRTYVNHVKTVFANTKVMNV